MKILFVHQNFPGQYLHLARHLARQPENQVVFITQRKDAELPGMRKIVYLLGQGAASLDRYLQSRT
jgi:hypothetical protein